MDVGRIQVNKTGETSLDRAVLTKQSNQGESKHFEAYLTGLLYIKLSAKLQLTSPALQLLQAICPCCLSVAQSPLATTREGGTDGDLRVHE